MTFDDKHIRWKKRFSNYRNVLTQQQNFIDKGDLSELEKQILIKAFENTFELSWNTLKDFLTYRGQTDIYVQGMRSGRPSPWSDKLQSGWMDMVQNSSRTSNTYNGEMGPRNL